MCMTDVSSPATSKTIIASVVACGNDTMTRFSVLIPDDTMTRFLTYRRSRAHTHTHMEGNLGKRVMCHRVIAGDQLPVVTNSAAGRDDDGTIRASRHLITTPVTAAIHARCGALVLTGHAEGLHARVDTAALNTAGEIAAICDRLATYSLTRTGLVHRDPGRIRGGHLRGPVVAEHRCGRAIPAEHRDNTAPAPAALADPDQCPF